VVELKQVVQRYSTGKLAVEEVPVPVVSPKYILVRNVASLVSAGTEKLMIELARKNLLGKALARPDLVKQVIDKVRTEGVKEAFEQSMSRLDTPIPLGYSCAGEVLEVGSLVSGISVGDRVACLGSGYASHAEVVHVPRNLVCLIPDGLTYEEAAFVGLGAIALHGVRHAEIQLGDRVAVIGLGLLGLIAVQLAKASGARVIGLDVDPDKVKLSRELGADMAAVIGTDDIACAVGEFTGKVGVDSVLIYASTRSNDPINLAGEIARERARIVAVGAVGLEIPRELFYHKELSVVVSRSWGPGIEDPTYERKAVDYPISYVRWTQQRNMQAFLETIADGKVNVLRLVTHRFSFENALQAYRLITGEKKEPYVGILLNYPSNTKLGRRLECLPLTGQRQIPSHVQRTVHLGFIGAGLFAKSVLLPGVKKEKGIVLCGLSTASGISGTHAAKKFGFRYCTTDYREILADPGVDSVVVATRHNLHASIVCEALAAGKNVFVEKPLAINKTELLNVYETARASTGVLVVGFNRRFSPFSVAAKGWLCREDGPMSIVCRVNAGEVPNSSWVQDLEEGGGRIVGEVCHFVDLVQYLTGSKVDSVWADAVSAAYESTPDNIHVNLRLTDGSVASIIYTAKGHKAFPRERVEVFRGRGVCVIDNFRSVVFINPYVNLRKRSWGVDRGHRKEIAYFLDVVRNPQKHHGMLESYVLTTLTTFAIEESIRTGSRVTIKGIEEVADAEGGR